MNSENPPTTNPQWAQELLGGGRLSVRSEPRLLLLRVRSFASTCHGRLAAFGGRGHDDLRPLLNGILLVICGLWCFGLRDALIAFYPGLLPDRGRYSSLPKLLEPASERATVKNQRLKEADTEGSEPPIGGAPTS